MMSLRRWLNSKAILLTDNPFHHGLFHQALDELKGPHANRKCRAAKLFHQWIHEQHIYKHVYSNVDPVVRRDFTMHYLTIVGALHDCSPSKYQKEILHLAIAPKTIAGE